MNNGLNGEQNGNDNGYGGNGNDYNPFLPSDTPQPNLMDQFDQSMMESETEKINAEAELEAAKQSLFEAKAGLGDPQRIQPLTTIMETEKTGALPIALLVGIALLIWGKIL